MGHPQPQSAGALASAVREGRRTAVAATEECLNRIESANGSLNVFREVYAERSLAAAHRIDGLVSKGFDPGALAGVPVALKDNIVTDWGSTTCGSRSLEHYRSPFTATAARKLIDAGAIIVGKTNCDEFAMGSSSESCAWGAVRNPWDPSRSPGGSSGGSAAAVAAGLTPVAVGSDTGGSVRQPASMCGVVGLKPSYGRVSRYGLVAYGSSLDQIGTLAGNVADAALMLQVMAGRDPHDSTSAADDLVDCVSGLETPVNNLRIGVPRQYLTDRNDPAVNQAVGSAIEVFKALDATIVDITLPMTDFGVATYYILATAEASSNLARFDGMRYGFRGKVKTRDLVEMYKYSRSEGFGPEVRRRIMLGTYVLSAGYYDAFYKKALQVRQLIKREFDAAFSQCHALIGPTAPTPAIKLNASAEPLSTYLADVYTVNTNLAGICGISVPGRFKESDGASLPIGVQLQGQAMDEATLLRISRMLEKATATSVAKPCPFHRPVTSP